MAGVFGETLKNTTNNTKKIIGGKSDGGVITGLNAARKSSIKGAVEEAKRTRDLLRGKSIKGGSAITTPIKNNFDSWGGLSPHLMISIQPCDLRTGELLAGYEPIVLPFNEANFELSLNWQSPFENAGAESKAPALMALLQSGQSTTYMNMLQGTIAQLAQGDGAVAYLAGGVNDIAGGAIEAVKGLSEELVGRTGITKLNSRQVFSGLPPIKITGNLHFRALRDTFNEVYMPYRQLLSWSLPQHLAKDGAIASMLQSGSLIKGLFPSKAPLSVSVTYANNTYRQMVVEAISNPMDGPKDTNGNDIYKVVNITLSSLTALDKNDVDQLIQYYDA